ncbi:hypothetical protein [uncultured Duncaniella sp.]|uniref:crAss001_48 related protein n=1 Tax=uncultured Duncaniella sp. TaxID=2768039 RepID=UPI002676F91B|nr:hypothetical protein [uncultured Duncaniella sp.]MCI9173299.1 hypothetical protein [Muribaculaceae bacterium]
MEKFKINLLNQQAKLEAHQRNLARFVEDDRFNRISFKEQTLIKKQVEKMDELNAILRERLSIHGINF